MADKHKDAFDRYILALRKTAVDDKTEHTDRAALQSLLQEIADETEKGVKVQHEPKRVADKGAPDFKISKGGLILGYVENKAIDANLNKVLKSEQVEKYKRVTVLDFACGTGTFLLETFQRIFDNIGGPDSGRRMQHGVDIAKDFFGGEMVVLVAGVEKGPEVGREIFCAALGHKREYKSIV